GRSAVDLVGQQQMGEHRSLARDEVAAPLVVDQRADQVGREQVGGELYALRLDGEGPCEGLDGEGLGKARDALDEDMAAGEQADQEAVEQIVLPDDDFAELGLDPLEGERLALDITVECSDVQFHKPKAGCASEVPWAARAVPRRRTRETDSRRGLPGAVGLRAPAKLACGSLSLLIRLSPCIRPSSRNLWASTISSTERSAAR